MTFPSCMCLGVGGWAGQGEAGRGGAGLMQLVLSKIAPLVSDLGRNILVLEMHVLFSAG